jgi:hypothetical protein
MQKMNTELLAFIRDFEIWNKWSVLGFVQGDYKMICETFDILRPV